MTRTVNSSSSQPADSQLSVQRSSVHISSDEQIKPVYHLSGSADPSAQPPSVRLIESSPSNPSSDNLGHHYSSVRPLSRRNLSAGVKRLDIDATRYKLNLVLGDLQVSTSPDPDIVPGVGHPLEYDSIDHTKTPTSSRNMKESYNMATTSSAPTDSSPASSGGRTPTNGNAITSSSTASSSKRYPPSPLSKIAPDGQISQSSNSVPFTPPSPNSANSSQFSPTPGIGPAESSPCFIHSQLDRHGTGSLQEWLKTRSSNPSASSASYSPSNHPTGHQHSGGLRGPHASRQGGVSFSTSIGQRIQAPARSTPSPNLSASVGSPSESVTNLSGGYDTDPSSMGGAIDDEDDEEGGSLTRQLAETAQGVREMSKELGRTRVRSRIQHVLIVTKARDNRLIKLTRELALYLMQKRPTSSPDGASRNGDRGMIVYVDAQLEHSKRFDAEGLERDYPELFKPISSRRASSSGTSSLSAFPSSSSVSEMERQKTDGQSQGQGQLRYWTAELCSSQSNLFDFVVTLGGDGTVLFTSWLFQRIVPPVLPFALGSLGFLTNFDFAKYKETMDRVVDDGIRVNLRMRFTCTVYRAIAPEDAAAADGQGRVRKAIKKSGGGIMMSRVEKNGWDSLEAPYGLSEDCRGCVGKDKEIMCFSTRPVEQFEVLNDLVVDRGPSPFVSLLELFGDEQHLTTVQADGLTVSTPTGSTAYSLSAGGSLVHPQIPALLITPICPHTLSFRPMLLPDSMELRICVPYNSRSTAWASFDGRGRVELKQGDHIKVTASKYPFPTVCADKASTDWFSAISRTLRWNEREKQKSFVVVEEDGEPSATQEHGSKHQHGPSRDGAKSKIPAHQGIAEEEEEDEEDEQFDIDDKSSGDATNPSSPHISATNPKHPLDRLKQIESPMKHVDGVSSPDRYVTKCDAPPPLSQRHLMRALAAAEINAKEGEVGDRDEIRAGSSNQRLDGNGHMIPSGRSPVASPSMALADMRNGVADLKTPRASHRHQHQHQQHHSHSHNHQHHPTTIGHSPQHHSSSRKPPPPKRQDSRAKAFAFFGQDDSASDMSDRSE